LPFFGEPLKGNTSDKYWNPETVERLSELLTGDGYRDILFVADCALVNTEDINRFCDPEDFILFVSRFPENFALAKELIDQAWRENNWQEIGQVVERKDAATYRMCSYYRQVGEHEFRLVVVHSSSLEAGKEKTLAKRMQKIHQSLVKEADRLAKNTFFCEADALKALEKFMAIPETRYYPLSGSVEKVVTQKHPRRGRPRAGEEPVTTETYRVVPQIGALNQEAFNELREREACFVLISNELDQEKRSNRDLLVSYKNLNNVEMLNRLLKDPAYLGPVYLKNKDRVKALTCVFILAMIVAKYIEYRVRKALEERNEQLRLPGSKKTSRPSFQTIKEYLATLLVGRLKTDCGFERGFFSNVDNQAIKLVEWAGFSDELYTDPKYLARVAN